MQNYLIVEKYYQWNYLINLGVSEAYNFNTSPDLKVLDPLKKRLDLKYI